MIFRGDPGPSGSLDANPGNSTSDRCIKGLAAFSAA